MPPFHAAPANKYEKDRIKAHTQRRTTARRYVLFAYSPSFLRPGWNSQQGLIPEMLTPHGVKAVVPGDGFDHIPVKIRPAQALRAIWLIKHSPIMLGMIVELSLPNLKTEHSPYTATKLRFVVHFFQDFPVIDKFSFLCVLAGKDVNDIVERFLLNTHRC